MKRIVDLDEFMYEFTTLDIDNWSETGLRLLYNHLIEVETKTGVEFSLDAYDFDAKYIEYSLNDLCVAIQEQLPGLQYQQIESYKSALKVGSTEDYLGLKLVAKESDILVFARHS